MQDLPLAVDLLVLRMFALRGVVRAAYGYAASRPEDSLVSVWCRDSILAALAGLIDLADTLAERFDPLHAQLGNDADNLAKTLRFLDHLHELRAALAASSGLPELATWCPPPLRPPAS
jgi:hypothetical protein